MIDSDTKLKPPSPARPAAVPIPPSPGTQPQDTPPQATVTQVGPLVYQVVAQHQWMEIGRWLVLTRMWARSKARRVLRAYQARRQWERQSTVVTLDELLD